MPPKYMVFTRTKAGKLKYAGGTTTRPSGLAKTNPKGKKKRKRRRRSRGLRPVVR